MRNTYRETSMNIRKMSDLTLQRRWQIFVRDTIAQLEKERTRLIALQQKLIAKKRTNSHQVTDLGARIDQTTKAIELIRKSTKPTIRKVRK